MVQTQFQVITDENVPNAVAKQLVAKGVDATRLIDHLPEGTPDPEVLEYTYVNGYSLITFDEHIKKHVENRIDLGVEHAGVFIAGDHLQGMQGIGKIVTSIVFIDQAIKGDAATIENDVYNRITYI